MPISNYIDAQVGVTQAQAFWDSSKLQQLKANSDSSASLHAVAKEFSSLMFHMMIKHMRDAEKAFKSILFSSSEYEHYTNLMDQQWATHLSNIDNNPIVSSIVKQFDKSFGQNQPVNDTQRSLIQSQTHYDKIPNNLLVEMKNHNPNLIYSPLVATTYESYHKPVPTTSSKDQSFANPQDFINKLLPHAINVAKTIGLDPKLLLAQAALETGWGTKIAKLPNGESSYNLFGIKAGNEWGGKKASSKTIEYENGMAKRKTDWFRAYDNFAESLLDYANLMRNSIRYKASINNAHVPQLYTKALQEAGFATDPHYANKIMQIYNRL